MSGFHAKSRSKPMAPKDGRIGSGAWGVGEQYCIVPCEMGGSGSNVCAHLPQDRGIGSGPLSVGERSCTVSCKMDSSAAHPPWSLMQVAPAKRQLLQGKPLQLFFERWHLVHALPGALRFCPDPTS
eukprot:155803-Rhodomonas_salina.1